MRCAGARKRRPPFKPIETRVGASRAIRAQFGVVHLGSRNMECEEYPAASCASSLASAETTSLAVAAASAPHRKGAKGTKAHRRCDCSNGPTRPGTRGASVGRHEVSVFRELDDRRDVVAVEFAERVHRHRHRLDAECGQSLLHRQHTSYAFCVSACSRSTMARGVFAGKARPPQNRYCASG